jgi:hypothetical protein
MARLMADAGITPNNDRVRSGDAELSRITGARKPSGVPVVIAAPAPSVPAQGSRRPRGGGSGGTGGSANGGSGSAQRRSRGPRRSGGTGGGSGTRPSRSV